jgi:serine protease
VKVASTLKFVVPVFSALVGLIVLSPCHAMDEPVTQIIVQPAAFHLAYATAVNAGEMANFSQAAQLTLAHVRAMSGQGQVLRLPHAMTRAEAETVVQRLKASGLVLNAQLDRRVYPRMVPNDPRYAEQWNYHALITGKPYGENNYGLNLPGAWDITTGSPSVVVAILDTGLLPHQDIDTNILDGVGRVVGGYDFISDKDIANDGDGRDADPTDPGDWVEKDNKLCGDGTFHPSSWHGTHVSVTVGALTNNGIGVSGVAWQVSLLPLRVLGTCGGSFSDVIDAMRWAVGLPVPGVADNLHPARILNMSFGGAGACEAAEQSAVDDVLAKGGMVVVVAGNSGDDLKRAPESPASCNGVFTIAATDQQGQRASYSNFGSEVELAAPGGEQPIDTGILSTVDTGQRTPDLSDGFSAQYGSYTGTSMAAPHVSGVLALMLALKADLGRAEALSLLQKSATAFPKYSKNPVFNCTTSTCGAGIVNAQAVLALMQGAAVPPSAPMPEPTPPIPEPPQQPVAASGGGGSMECLSLLGLFGLAALRHRLGHRLRQRRRLGLKPV